MKACSVLSAFILHVCMVNAQTVVPGNIRASNTLEEMIDIDGLGKGELFYGIPMAPGKVIGDTYLDSHWKVGTILLYDKEKLIDRFPLRYDIQANELDIKSSSGVKVISGNKVKSFSWVDSISNSPTYFINAADFRLNEAPLSGFLQVLTDGPFPLLMKTFLVVKKADYNVQLDMGSKDDKILKRTDFYCLKSGNKVMPVPSSKKKTLLLFGDHASDVEKFMKEQALGVTKQQDLTRVFEYYNSLIRK